MKGFWLRWTVRLACAVLVMAGAAAVAMPSAFGATALVVSTYDPQLGTPADGVAVDPSSGNLYFDLADGRIGTFDPSTGLGQLAAPVPGTPLGQCVGPDGSANFLFNGGLGAVVFTQLPGTPFGAGATVTFTGVTATGPPSCSSGMVAFPSNAASLGGFGVTVYPFGQPFALQAGTGIAASAFAGIGSLFVGSDGSSTYVYDQPTSRLSTLQLGATRLIADPGLARFVGVDSTGGAFALDPSTLTQLTGAATPPVGQMALLGGREDFVEVYGNNDIALVFHDSLSTPSVLPSTDRTAGAATMFVTRGTAAGAATPFTATPTTFTLPGTTIPNGVVFTPPQSLGGVRSLVAGAIPDSVAGSTDAGKLFTAQIQAQAGDTVPPVVATHPDVTAEATGPDGAAVSYTAPTAVDDVDGSVPVTCSPPSGSTFKLGDTTVDCSASDAAGNVGHSSFTVHVVDTTPPVLQLPSSPIVVDATSAAGAAVVYSASAHDLVDGAVTPTCAPPSGATFPIGDTVVTCRATDAHGNTSAPGTFTVHVRGAADELAALLAFVHGLPPGTSLEAKVVAAQAALAAGDVKSACGSLAALVNQTAAQTGKTLTSDQAATITGAEQRIAALLGC